MCADQRQACRRPDVLVYQTDALEQDVTLAGALQAELHVATSGTDSAWVVKLIDVYPEDYIQPESHEHLGGYELIISDEVFRGRFHKSFEHPEALVANEPTHFRIDLHTRNHAFLKGHKIMVQVQSTWFPLIDRNPQKFTDIYRANAADFVRATERVYHSEQRASNAVDSGTSVPLPHFVQTRSRLIDFGLTFRTIASRPE